MHQTKGDTVEYRIYSRAQNMYTYTYTCTCTYIYIYIYTYISDYRIH